MSNFVTPDVKERYWQAVNALTQDAARYVSKTYHMIDLEAIAGINTLNQPDVTPDHIRSITDKFPINLDWLITGEGSMYDRDIDQHITNLIRNYVEDEIRVMDLIDVAYDEELKMMLEPAQHERRALEIVVLTVWRRRIQQLVQPGAGE